MGSGGKAHLLEPLTDREQEVLELLAQGKTNREIADALVLSVNTVKWYNRQIYGKLGVGNREEAAARARELGLVEAEEEGSGAGRYNLPAKSMPLIGREEELAAVGALLAGEARLVTIVGPGGIGKTCLALEVAHQLAGRFGEGAAFADLAPLASAAGIVPAVAQALRFKPAGGAGERRQLLNYLQGKRLLLVLDNFEQLLDGAPLLAEILAAAPQVKLLVTSRERLKLRVEQVYALGGLAYSGWETLEQARQDPAVQLFMHYGRRVRPAYELLEEELAALQQMVQRVDGMPLALILAAAWLELLRPAEIAGEIEGSLDFLEADYRDLPGRQRSMRAVFETTWARLSEREQTLFAALSVFPGGFTLAAARAVSGATLRELLALVHRSLLVRGEEGRFGLHELLRQFAAEQLARSPAREKATRSRHADYYLSFLSESERDLKGAGAEAALEALAAEIDNIHAAWNWSIARQAFVPLGAGAFSLAEFAVRSGRYEDSASALGHAIEALRHNLSERTAVRPSYLLALVRLLTWQCQLQRWIGSFDQAKALGNEALSILARPEMEDARRERAYVLYQLSYVTARQDRSEEASEMLQEALSIFRDVSDSSGIVLATGDLGDVAVRLANYEQAERYHRQAMELNEALGHRRTRARLQTFLGMTLSSLGRWDEADRLMRAGIDSSRELDDRALAAISLTILTEETIYRGRFEEAQEMAAEAMKEHQALGQESHYAHTIRRWCEATLHLGNYQAALDQLPAALEFAHTNGARMSLGMGNYVAGAAWLAMGEMAKARDYLAEGVHILRLIESRDYLCAVLPALSLAHTLEKNFSQSKAILREVIDIALVLGTTLHLAPGLAAAARLLAAAGEGERAVALYALACREPYVANSRWSGELVGQPVATRAEALPSEVVAVARARGEAGDLREAGEELLQELKGVKL